MVKREGTAWHRASNSTPYRHPGIFTRREKCPGSGIKMSVDIFMFLTESKLFLQIPDNKPPYQITDLDSANFRDDEGWGTCAL